MRNSIGGAWLFSISIILMMFIIAYVTITIDYSNSYQLKDDVLLYIEQYNGLNKDSAKLIINRMKSKKYTTKTKCNKDYDSTTYYSSGSKDGQPSKNYYALIDYSGKKSNALDSFAKGNESNPKDGYICVYKYTAIKGQYDNDKLTKSFYAVSTSFGFNFPIIGDVFDFRVTGETNVINYPNDGVNWDS